MSTTINYNLEERTGKFGEQIIELCKNLKPNIISTPIINQLVKSATSIGANYMEANGASSKKDFKNKIFICKKEAKETKHWLRMLLKCIPDKQETILNLSQECHELILIFSKIIISLNLKIKN